MMIDQLKLYAPESFFYSWLLIQREKMKSNDKRQSEIEEEMKKVEIIKNQMKEMDELLKDSVYHIEEEERVKNMKSNDKEESKTRQRKK